MALILRQKGAKCQRTASG